MEPVNQGTLLQVLHTIFPSTNIINNDRQVLNKDSVEGQVLELDCWVPELRLALEFQDNYHYEPKWYKQETQEAVMLRDERKRIVVLTSGHTLVIIPYWWDGSKESTIGEIKFHRPDLFTKVCEAYEIPLNPPFQYRNSNIPPHLGDLMAPTFPPIGRLLNVSEFSPWWLGEKYDGIRVCWNPVIQVLATRADNQIVSFEKYISLFPATFLDGELWCGRNNFIHCHKLLFISAFAFMRVMVFDFPVLELLFEQRYKELVCSISAEHQFLEIAPRIHVNSVCSVSSITKTILDHSGEGIILQKLFTAYKSGIAETVLKLKAHQRDGEALVVENHNKWFTIKLLQGALIPLEASNLAVGIKISKGDIVTFSYDGINFQRLPCRIKILRVRNDITWKDLHPTEDFSRAISSAENLQIRLNAASAHAFGQIKAWQNTFSPQELQMFFNTLAQVYQINPKRADEWYTTLTSQRVRTLKGGRTVQQACGGIVAALQSAYPDIQFEHYKFTHKRKNFWEEPKNVRLILDGYAKSMGFDPYIATNWYKYISNPSLNQYGIQTRGTFFKLLIFAYPNIGIDATKFYRNPKRYLYIQQPYARLTIKPRMVLSKKRNQHWQSLLNQKIFFDSFAQLRQFDPLLLDSWKQVLVRDITATGPGRSIMKYYSGTNRLYNALHKIYKFVM